MFGKKKDAKDAEERESEASGENKAEDIASAPPLKPFSRKALTRPPNRRRRRHFSPRSRVVNQKFLVHRCAGRIGRWDLSAVNPTPTASS